jgi:hypothetical protein
MSLFRLVIIGFAIYLISKVFKNFLNPSAKNRTVEGDQTVSDPLDLTDADVEDVEFEEIDDE